jgi:hypothetical protein
MLEGNIFIVMLSANMLVVIALDVIMLGDVAPKFRTPCLLNFNYYLVMTLTSTVS